MKYFYKIQKSIIAKISIVFILVNLVGIFKVNAQIVSIPDAAFKAALVANGAINTGGNLAEIEVSEAAAFTGPLILDALNISNLTGIEAFTNITGLSCQGNLFTTLDLSANTALVYIDCSFNSITSLNVTNITTLTTLACSSNDLTSLDVSTNTGLQSLSCSYNLLLTSLDVSNNTALLYLYCNYNPFGSLDVSNNTSLTELYCADNQLTNLNVTNNTALTHLECQTNLLTSLDVSANTLLTYLDCGANLISSIDLSTNTALLTLLCSDNNLTSLDVSNNTSLLTLRCYNNYSALTSLVGLNNCPSITIIECFNNSLSSLNIQNGNNFLLTSFSASGNPNLKCILVSDDVFMNTNFSGTIDAGTIYSFTPCPRTTVADGNWSNPAIWNDGGVPIAGVNISIYHNVVVNTDVTEVSNSLTINSGAAVTVIADGVLRFGDVVNNGTMETNGTQGAQLRMHSQTFTNNGTINLNSTGINPNLGGSGGQGGLIGYIFWTPVNPVITNNGVLNINGSEANFTQQNVVFNNTGAINNLGALRLDGWDATTTWNNSGAASYSGGGRVEFGATISGNANYTSSAVFTILRLYLGQSHFNFQQQINIGNFGEVVVYNPTFNPLSIPFNYGTDCVLFYEATGVVNKGKEWDETSGLGQPSIINVNSRLNMGSVSTNSPITVRTINVQPSGSLLLDSIGFVRTAPLEITNNLTLSGRLNLSTNTGGYLILGGDLNAQASSVINSNDRKLVLNGNSNQTIQKSSGTLSFGELEINKTGGEVFLGSPLNLTLDNGNLIDFVSETTLNLNGNNININTLDGFIRIYSNYPTITSTTPAKILFGSGTYNFDMIAGTLIVGNNVTLATNAAAGSLNMSTFIDLYGTLEINHPAYTITGEINYQMGSFLLYTFNGSRTTSDEWNTFLNGTSQPKNVSLTGSATNVSLTNSPYRLTQSLFINDGCTLNGTQKLGIRENVTVEPTGSLNLTGSGSLEFFASSNCEINIQSTPALPSTCSIEINKSTGTVRLVNNLNGIGGVDFIGTANFDLNGSYNIIIDPAGQILNEGNGNGRIINTGNPKHRKRFRSNRYSRWIRYG
jgi:Leucine-rich repeat (LRR) protein